MLSLNYPRANYTMPPTHTSKKNVSLPRSPNSYATPQKNITSNPTTALNLQKQEKIFCTCSKKTHPYENNKHKLFAMQNFPSSQPSS